MKSLIIIIDGLIYTISLVGINYLMLCIPSKVISLILSIIVLILCFFMILPMLANMIIGYVSGAIMILLGGNKEVNTPIAKIKIIYFVSMIATISLIWILCPIYDLKNILVCISSTVLSFIVWGIKIKGIVDLHNSIHDNK